MKITFRCILILFLFTIFEFTFAQNLIPDPSFEGYKKNKKYSILVDDFKYWSVPNKSSPDVYCTYNTISYYPLLIKTWGKQVFAKKGDTYIGLIIYSPKYDKEFREYVKTKLNNPLVKGHKYCFSVYIRLGKTCRLACNGLDLLLTSNNITSSENELTKTGITPTIASLGNIIIEKNDWVLICGSFVANGEEKYLIIGNFKDNNKTKVIEIEKKNFNHDCEEYECSYYLIDDVSLIEIENEDNCNCSENKELLSFADTTKTMAYTKIPVLPAGVSFAISNLYFSTNEWEILPKSFIALDSLYSILFENKNINILITGHTDNTGKEEWNLELSKNRAKAVADYLIKKGISVERIIYEGKGSSYPIATNDTDTGKEMNRRVEIMISKK